MTMKEEAYQLIDSLPENSLRFIVKLIRNMSPEFRNGEVYGEPVEYIKGRRKLDQIALLKDNWNGNGATAFSKRHISRIETILSALQYEPEIFPVANEMIQLEYDKPNGEHIEIEIPETGLAEYYFVDQNKKEHFGSIEADAETISALIRRFYESEV